MTEPRDAAQLGLLLDYGGVLTTPVGKSFFAWEDEQGLERGEVLRLVREAYADADGGIVGRLERGEIETAEFDAELARLLAERGRPVPEGRLVEGMFAHVRPADAMWEVAKRARDAGVRVGLLSNSWGTGISYRDGMDAIFDVQVISAEVGLRKPDPAIYQLAAQRLGLPPSRCAFVDDLPRNVEVAEELGMFGVVHAGDAVATAQRLASFLPVDPADVG